MKRLYYGRHGKKERKTMDTPNGPNWICFFSLSSVFFRGYLPLCFLAAAAGRAGSFGVPPLLLISRIITGQNHNTERAQVPFMILPLHDSASPYFRIY